MRMHTTTTCCHTNMLSSNDKTSSAGLLYKDIVENRIMSANTLLAPLMEFSFSLCSRPYRGQGHLNRTCRDGWRTASLVTFATLLPWMWIIWSVHTVKVKRNVDFQGKPWSLLAFLTDEKMRRMSVEKTSIRNYTNWMRSQISRNLFYAKSHGLIMTALTL